MKTDAVVDIDFEPERMSQAFRHRRGRPNEGPPLAQVIGLLDLQDGTPAVQRLRQWALDAVDVRPGEAAVDVGSGTGSVTQLLAGLVGRSGSAVGIEPNPAMLAEAAYRAGAAGSTASFLDGTADELPFAADSVDVLWCERVLQHVDDPQAAIVEFARVLRPGGRAILIDSDHATRVVADLDLDVEHRLLATFLATAPNPRAARHIPRQTRTAGLELDDDIGSAALILPQWVNREAVLLKMTAIRAVRDGVVTQAEADSAVASLRAAADEGVSFSAVTMFGFVARHP